MVNDSQPSDYCTDFSDHIDESTIASGFRDENVCGVGATCVVYAMRLGGIRVAVKRLKNEYISDPVHIAAYRKEYRIGQRLKHDALPLYRDFKPLFNDVYIVMDFIDGISLSDFVNTAEGKQFFSNSANVRRFLSQMLSVLAYLHRSGVIHCDIKPANIMLRHSDRAAMLIDLDKSYCDILDTTQGGTRDISDPLTAGDKPTIHKDYAALGKVIELIANKVPKFPGGQFKKFQRECLSENATDERLNKALENSSSKASWLVLSLFTIAIAITGILIFSPTANEKPENLQLINQGVENPDSVSDQDTKVEPEVIEPQRSFAVQKDIIVDFDNQMAAFISEIEEANQTLLTGNASDRQLRDLMDAIIDSYTSNYHSILTDRKSKNPDMSGTDVELQLARKAEKAKRTF